MRLIPFPRHSEVDPAADWLTGLEDALSGTGAGPQADTWRQLREDVRALAPPIAPEFRHELGGLVAAAHEHPAAKKRRGRLARLLGPRYLGAAGAAAVCATVAVVLIATPRPGSPHQPATFTPVAAANAGRAGPTAALTTRAGAPGRATNKSLEASGAAAGTSESASGGAASGAPSSSPVTAPGRVQQLAASITLTAAPSAVQETADRVSGLVVGDGGYVQSSHVNVGGSTGEASMSLSLPSAKLGTALAALERLAAVRSESQSLQDITSTYDAARQRLTDATTERQALLRALAKATTEGQIDSLRERLSQARSMIAQDDSALRAVSRQASTADVEVTIVGDSRAGSEGLTLHRGLHDAGRVLVVALVALLIAAAVLVPLALVIVLSLAGTRAWLRYRRERALDAD